MYSHIIRMMDIFNLDEIRQYTGVEYSENSERTKGLIKKLGLLCVTKKVVASGYTEKANEHYFETCEIFREFNGSQDNHYKNRVRLNLKCEIVLGDFTKEEIERKTGIGWSELYKFINGSKLTSITMEQLQLLADLYNADLNDIMNIWEVNKIDADTFEAKCGDSVIVYSSSRVIKEACVKNKKVLSDLADTILV